MFIYSKKLQYPVKIKNPNPKLAKIILTQYGGPDGELGASLRYLSQRYSMPFDELKGLLTDIATEELGHLEMVGSIVHQLTRNLKDEQMKDPAFAPYFVDHTAGVYPASAAGVPWTAASMQVKGDPMAAWLNLYPLWYPSGRTYIGITGTTTLETPVYGNRNFSGLFVPFSNLNAFNQKLHHPSWQTLDGHIRGKKF